MRLMSSKALVAGQHQIQQHQVGLLRLEEVFELVGIAGDDGRVARLGQRVADIVQRLGVVVDDEDGLHLRRRWLRLVAGGADGAGGGRGLVQCRDGEGEPGAVALALAVGPDAASVGFD